MPIYYLRYTMIYLLTTHGIYFVPVPGHSLVRAAGFLPAFVVELLQYTHAHQDDQNLAVDLLPAS